MNVDYRFNKCPGFDSELSNWSLIYPKLKYVFFNGDSNSEEKIYALANLKTIIEPIDKNGKKDIEYGLEEDQIINIMGHYAGEKLDSKYIKTVVEESRRINNIVRKWEDYDVPAAEKGFYQISGSGVFRIVEVFNAVKGENQSLIKDVCRTPFVICGISEPLNDDSIYYKIRYKTYNGTEKEFWAGQSILLSRRELKTLFLSKGINCPENSLLIETIEYISRSISEFGPAFKKELSAKRNGWDADKSIFVLGNRGITAKGTQPVLAVVD